MRIKRGGGFKASDITPYGLYITGGMTALTLPLAATSTTAAIQKLGGKAWQRLHRLAYAVGVCAVLHYLRLAKKANPAPYYYAAVLVLLLAIRAWDWSRQRLARLRSAASVPPGGRAELASLPARTSRQRQGA